MRACAIAIAALLTMAGAASAEPAKHDGQRPVVQRQRPAVVLASADTIRAPSPAAPQATSVPVKRPAPRVTTCRCGDQQADPESQEQ